MTTLYLAAGCFWGAQNFLRQIPGVQSTRVGYANGRTEHPTYEEVKYRRTGHAETVEICYDETQLSTSELLDCYFLCIDPTAVNRQGPDVGEQYRTGIYYTDPSMVPLLRAKLEALEAEIGQPVAVELKPLEQFFPAEEYHQDYLIKNPTGYCHIPRDLIQKVKRMKKAAERPCGGAE